MVSLKDIAAACNVSVATVSKALNGQSDISEATRDHIAAVAKEMGYFPNSAAKALKTKRTKNIGVLFADEARSGLTHDYFSHILDSFKKESESAGYDITFINCNSVENMTYLEHAKYRNFDGVVIACIAFDAAEVYELVQSDIPIVTIDYMFNGHIAVLSNNQQGMQELLEYIYDRGHKKIAYIHGLDSGVTRSRLTTFYKLAEQNDIDVPDEYIKEVAYRDVTGCYKATLELLELNDPPTCILFPDDYAGLGGMNAIREKGLSVPEDISIAGFDGIETVQYVEPKITTYKQDTTKVGAVAAQQLIDLIERPKTTQIRPIVIDGYLLKGKTVKDIKNN